MRVAGRLARVSAIAIVAIATVAATSALTGCARDETDGRSPAGITVLAASSLTDAFTFLADRFEAEHPDTTITLGFGASSELARQIEQGAPADVFASADVANMERLVGAGAIEGDPVELVANRLAIAVEEGNPLRIDDLADLAKPGLTVVLCASSAPCGAFADEVLHRAGVTVAPASRDANARAALSKVELGEADAAIVYASDVTSTTHVEGVAIPSELNVTTTLTIAAVADRANPALAADWIAFVNAHVDELVDRFGFSAL